MMSKDKLLLIILDGWGLSSDVNGNAPFAANTPVLDNIYNNYPKTSLTASGTEVGLLAGEPGNSEVGHSNIGSGKVVWQNLPKIDHAIKSGDFANNYYLSQVFGHARKNNRPLHFVTMVSDGGIHSHIHHLVAALEAAAAYDVQDIIVHFISDGRDTPAKKALVFVKQLNAIFQKIGRGHIATITGRYYAMDRDKNMDRTLAAYDLYTQNKGVRYSTVEDAINANYKSDKSDEFIEPSVIAGGGKINKGDAIVFLNYRSDRMKQIFSMFTKVVNSISYADGYAMCTMAQYIADTNIPIIFPPSPDTASGSLAQTLSQAGKNQFHVAETEKYAHVTYFLNSGVNKVFPGERDFLVPSKKVLYNKAPEMSADAICRGVVTAIGYNYDFIVVNFANGDMVGHTGDYKAAVKGCEVVDNNLGKILSSASAKKYKVMIISDHGNCDAMIDELSGKPNKEHTLNPVPCVLIDFTAKSFSASAQKISKDKYLQYAATEPIGVLADVAPTLLAHMKISKPQEMVGMDITNSLSSS